MFDGSVDALAYFGVWIDVLIDAPTSEDREARFVAGASLGHRHRVGHLGHEADRGLQERVRLREALVDERDLGTEKHQLEATEQVVDRGNRHVAIRQARLIAHT